VQRVDGRAIGGGEMHPDEARTRPLPQREHVMLGAAAAQMHRVALRKNRLEAPDAAVEGGGLMQVAHRKLDAAQSGDFGIEHGGALISEEL